MANQPSFFPVAFWLRAALFPGLTATATAAVDITAIPSDKTGMNNAALAALNPDVQKGVERSLQVKTPGHDRMYYDLARALEAYRSAGGIE